MSGMLELGDLVTYLRPSASPPLGLSSPDLASCEPAFPSSGNFNLSSASALSNSSIPSSSLVTVLGCFFLPAGVDDDAVTWEGVAGSVEAAVDGLDFFFFFLGCEIGCKAAR